MSRIFFIYLLCICTLLAENDLTVSPEMINLGEIPDIKKVDMSFEIKNQGKKEIIIEKVETSCGCSSATPDPKTIKSGKSSKIKVTLNPKGKKGYNSWQVKIFTNSITDPILYVSFDAKILHTGVLSHKFITFGEFRQEVAQKKEFWISPENFPKFKITSIKQNLFTHKKKCFDIEITDDTYDGFYPGARPGKRITIKTKKDISYGRIDGELVVKTNIPNHEEMRLSILARVAGDIGIRPDSVSFGLLRKKKVKSRHIYIYHRNGASFEIKNIRSPWKEVSIKTEVMIPKQYYKLILTCKPSSSTKNGEMRGDLIIETSDKQQAIIKIPMQGYAVN